jgi:hypothetical protein
LITNDLLAAAKDLFTRDAERMIIEHELDADISGFQLNAHSSGLPPQRRRRHPTGCGATSSTTPGPSPSRRTTYAST